MSTFLVIGLITYFDYDPEHWAPYLSSIDADNIFSLVVKKYVSPEKISLTRGE